MKHLLPELPFAQNALEPYMSAESLEYHHDRHHRGYVDKLNQLIQGTEFQELALEEIIATSSGPIFNNAAQIWNHTFFWQCLTPQFREPQGKLREAIERDFGSLEEFTLQFEKSANDIFGSGWAWLVRNDSNGKLNIETTGNANDPLTSGRKPLLTCDVWEHAYYIDYRNERSKFLKGVSQILNWEFAENCYATTWELAA